MKGDVGPEEAASARYESLSIFEGEWFCLGNPVDRRAWQTTVHGVKRDGQD